MKKLHLLGMSAVLAVALASCGSSKNLAVESSIDKQTSLEGEKVVVETTKLQGIEMVDDLSEDGIKMIKTAYKWYAGIGKADDKQTAIEMAELEARATISRVIENAVKVESERGTVANNGEVQKALTSHWNQISVSIQNACEPFGDTRVEYSQTTKMYTVTQKVGVRGDKFQKMLNNAGNYKPSNLSGKDLEDFIEVNKSIMEAAKGN
ncbi:MAG: hypothetical protein MJZ56_03305 [Bacteroidales bacterium]|nr:hypothetical protein [Bacteroidales bacterium]